jgi:hypothetical protein
MSSSNDVLEKLKSELNDFKNKQKNGSQNGARKVTNILSKYFVPRADIENFRIIKPKSDKSNKFIPIQEAYFHEITLNDKGGKKALGKKVYCPAHNEPMQPKLDESGNQITDQNGKPVMVPVPCALCEKSKKILKKQDPSLRGKKKEELSDTEKIIFENNKKIFTEASKWEAKKFYIVEGIDKGNVKDGKKFWRFKKNFRNQGVFDKLMPALNQFISVYEKNPVDPNEGADLSITMSDAQMPNGKPYRSVSAIIAKPPSKLHEDPLIVDQWINDPITWRDVFKAKTAPNITPQQFLELAAEGNDPYWDDSDQNNKRWIFPNNPELEAKANQRDRNLDANTNEYKNFEQASDVQNLPVETVNNDGVTISNVTKEDVGSFDNKTSPKATDVTGDLDDSDQTDNSSDNTSDDSYDGDYEDLPF